MCNKTVTIHSKLAEEGLLDAAYKYSVDNYDVFNMQMVLRAHGFPHTFEDADSQIEYAKQAFQK